MQNFVIEELSRINFEAKVKSIVTFLGLKSDLNLIFIGVGKLVYVAKRLTASFVSMNVRCRYLHAADALLWGYGNHRLRRSMHTFILFCRETAEIIDLARHLSDRNCKVLSVTNQSDHLLRLYQIRVSIDLFEIAAGQFTDLPGFEKIPSHYHCMQTFYLTCFLIDRNFSTEMKSD